MPEHGSPLIATIAAGLVVAFAFGLLAHRLRISPLIGYLLAGTLVGPFTPGFVADQALADQLAEVGVILLLFAVGLHFSLANLVSVRRTALPGALIQLTASTLLGIALAWSLGWGVKAGVLFGLALACASTVVLTRSLQEHRLLDTESGRVAVGWVVVQDVAMIVALVLLPNLGAAADTFVSWSDLALTLSTTVAKVAGFVALMLIVGRRAVPWILHYAAHTGSRELFRLSVYAVALGVAYGAAMMFGVSFALGAFFAGMVLAESPLSQRATEEALPLRDAFAVLFFVSVGMLFNPAVLLERPSALVGTLAVIIAGNGLAAFLAVRLLGQPVSTALTVAAGLGQIGEFSFILAGLGVGMGLLPPEGRDLILAGAILSILVNPFFFNAVQHRRVSVAPAVRKPAHVAPTVAPQNAASAPRSSDANPAATEQRAATTLEGHDVVVGYGRVGSRLGRDLSASGRAVLVFEERQAAIDAALGDGAEVVVGNAADPAVLAIANLNLAQRLFITIAEPFEAGQVVQQARAANPSLEIVARAHSDAEVAHLDGLGADLTVMGEREIAYRMIERARVGGGDTASVEAKAISGTPVAPGIASDAEPSEVAARNVDQRAGSASTLGGRGSTPVRNQQIREKGTRMRRSTDRILTTHTGSLPRPRALTRLHARRARGEAVDASELAAAAQAAVAAIVPRQIAAGIDVPNNGEQGRESFVLYLRDRLTGLGGQSNRGGFADVEAYPEFKADFTAAVSGKEAASVTSHLPSAVAPVTYIGQDAMAAELAEFDAALASAPDAVTDTFMAAPSPGIVAAVVQNRHYDNEERYLAALAEALRAEYRAILDAGHTLQIDCPDLALERHGAYQDLPLSDFLAFCERAVSAVNAAIAQLPRERIRLHVCWGNYEAPHDRDVPFADIWPVIRKLRVGGFVLPFANPRHAHEHKVFRHLPLADDQILVAGVIDTLTNFVEHPEVVAERLERIAESMGDPTRLLAGTDCGFDTSAGRGRVSADVVWAKLASLAEGARLASTRMF